MTAHSAHLFNWQAFTQEARPLVKALDAGDFGPMLAGAREAADYFRATPSAWLLDSYSRIRQWEPPSSAKGIKPIDIESCFLLLLATHLRPCPANLGAYWEELSMVVTFLNGNFLVGKLLTKGWSTLSLVRPERKREPTTTDVGWLDLDTIQALQERLMALRPMMAHAPRSYGEAIVGPAGTLHLVPAYEQATAMLAAAIEANTGLFFAFVKTDWSDLGRPVKAV